MFCHISTTNGSFIHGPVGWYCQPKGNVYYLNDLLYTYVQALTLRFDNNKHLQGSGGSRISRWGRANLRLEHFSAKMYAKMKELDPVGGAHTGSTPLGPPMQGHCEG